MKCSKKVFAATVAAAMIATMGASSVFAAGLDDGTTGSGSTNNQKSTQVKYTVAQSYEWSVPSEITFTAENDEIQANNESGTTQKVKVTKNVIPDGKELKITAKGSGSDGAFTIVPDGKSNTLAYSIKVNGGEAINVSGTVLEVKAGTNSGSAGLTFTLTKDTTEKAGEYKGTVTYTAVVVDATN